MSSTTERLHQLFLLNLVLQIFDGVATYLGIHLWGEANPLLAMLMSSFGAGLTLLLFKANACGFLVLLRRLGHHPLVADCLVVLATVYTFFSFIPWMVRYAALLHLSLV
jgi:hypothetical protein